jgi:SAM-dependent methyltransferase
MLGRRRTDLSLEALPVIQRLPYGRIMNKEHLDLCSSREWRDILRDLVLPYALGDVRLGDDVLEVGPGPGMTTDLLRTQLPRLTAVELDESLASALRVRMAGTNVEVLQADATAMPFEDARFTGAVSFTMLHHVPTPELQDRLFGEVARVLRPGGVFVASDSIASDELAALHHGDVYNPIEPATMNARLLDAGYSTVDVRSNEFGWAAHAVR